METKKVEAFRYGEESFIEAGDVARKSSVCGMWVRKGKDTGKDYLIIEVDLPSGFCEEKYRMWKEIGHGSSGISTYLPPGKESAGLESLGESMGLIGKTMFLGFRHDLAKRIAVENGYDPDPFWNKSTLYMGSFYPLHCDAESVTGDANL